MLLALPEIVKFATCSGFFVVSCHVVVCKHTIDWLCNWHGCMFVCMCFLYAYAKENNCDEVILVCVISVTHLVLYGIVLYYLGIIIILYCGGKGVM